MPYTNQNSTDRTTGPDLIRGVIREFEARGIASLREFTLGSGRRCDVIGVEKSGQIWIAEIKSSLNDFRSDQKWQNYLEYCDYFFFGVAGDFPLDVLPRDQGLILADAYGAEIARMPDKRRLATARRSALTRQIATTALNRLREFEDPRAVNSDATS